MPTGRYIQGRHRQAPNQGRHIHARQRHNPGRQTPIPGHRVQAGLHTGVRVPPIHARQVRTDRVIRGGAGVPEVTAAEGRTVREDRHHHVLHQVAVEDEPMDLK